MSAPAPLLLAEPGALRRVVANWRAAGERVALVATMGALHDGHRVLVAQARKDGHRVVASIFVNPTQFGPSEDFSRYPRDLEADLTLLGSAGADAAWTPSVATMYPAGFSTQVAVSGLGDGLCGAFRPGHFSGVATVVVKLLGQVRPDLALFGEKDFQQLRVIQQAAADLDLDVAIEGVATVREADGLALSSRNRYLSPAERSVAPVLHRVLGDVAAAARDGEVLSRPIGAGLAALGTAGFQVQYLTVCDAHTLMPVERVTAPARILVAAYLGRTRLIDNVAV